MGILERILRLLQEILDAINRLIHAHQATQLLLQFHVPLPVSKVEKIKMSAVSQVVGGVLSATVAPLDINGAPATLASAPVWAVDNVSVATVTPAADGLSAVFSLLVAGTATVTVTGDPGQGATPLVATGVITVTPVPPPPNLATQLVLTFKTTP